MTKLFDNISPKNKDILLKKLEASTLSYSKGVKVLSNMSNRSKENFIAVIESGSAHNIRTDYNGVSTILEEYNEGDIFGSIISSINSEENNVITKEPSKITYIDYSKITNSEISNEKYYIIFYKNLLEIISDIVAAKNERINILTKRSTRDKLLEFFNTLSVQKSSRVFTIPYSFTDLASYLCVDRSAMTREIKNLKEEGFIKVTGKRITLNY